MGCAEAESSQWQAFNQRPWSQIIEKEFIGRLEGPLMELKCKVRNQASESQGKYMEPRTGK